MGIIWLDTLVGFIPCWKAEIGDCLEFEAAAEARGGMVIAAGYSIIDCRKLATSQTKQPTNRIGATVAAALQTAKRQQFSHLNAEEQVKTRLQRPEGKKTKETEHASARKCNN